ncbi:MAG: deoxyribodipyrimidine photolyase, partial [Gemmatimonadota bacterium]|nr:deoxyribodipyrimidine photolyase [Gemmatimonadota bacterium]
MTDVGQCGSLSPVLTPEPETEATMDAVPDIRLRRLNEAPERDGADYVLYWMVAARRLGWNFGLQRAVEAANRRRLPLVVFEPLRCGYRWASDRLHSFVIDGMREHAGALADRPGVRYVPYVERSVGEGRGLLSRLASRAALVVTDDWPCFFLPRMQEAAAARLDVRLEVVDGNGLLPLRAADRVFPTAHGFRRHLQRELGPYLTRLPAAEPLAALQADVRPGLPAGVADAWPLDPAELLAGGPDLADLPIDHAVGPVEGRAGGSSAARRRLERFLDEGLARYGERRNAPEEDAASRLS